MADKVVEIPGVGNVAFPDSMSDAEISVQARLAYNRAQHPSPEGMYVGPGATPKLVSAAGKYKQDEVPNQIPSYYGFTPRNMASNVWGGAKSLVSGLYEMSKDLASNPNWFTGENSTAQKFLYGPSEEQTRKAGEALMRNDKSAAYGHALASGIPLIGPWGASLGEQAGTGDVGGAVGQAGGTVIAGTAIAKGVSTTTKLLSRAKVPISKSAAVNQLVRAVNPDPKIAPSMSDNLAAHLDRLSAYAKESGQKINSIAELAKVADSAAKVDPYRKLFIEPNADIRVTAPAGFRGRVSQSEPGGIASTTIGDLDARLSQINDTLHPKFQKGGPGSVSAQAAIGSEDVLQLAGEAQRIRATLADSIGQKMGVDPAVVYQMRGRYGQLEQLAEQTRLEAGKTTKGQNRAANEPLRAGDIVSGVGRIPINPKNWVPSRYGTVADRMVADVFRRYQPGAVEPIIANPRTAPAANRNPRWANQSEASANPTFQMSSKEDILANQQRMATNRLRQAITQSNKRGDVNVDLNQKARRFETHGKYKKD